jgi:hypothetical protein
VTIGGWVFMLSSLAFVWGLTGWCLHRVLHAPSRPAGGEAIEPSRRALARHRDG